jgi:hypothetical protein
MMTRRRWEKLGGESFAIWVGFFLRQTDAWTGPLETNMFSAGLIRLNKVIHSSNCLRHGNRERDLEIKSTGPRAYRQIRLNNHAMRPTLQMHWSPRYTFTSTCRCYPQRLSPSLSRRSPCTMHGCHCYPWRTPPARTHTVWAPAHEGWTGPAGRSS